MSTKYPVKKLDPQPKLKKGEFIGVAWFIRLPSGEHLINGMRSRPYITAEKKAYWHEGSGGSQDRMPDVEAFASQVDGEIYGEEYEWCWLF